MQKKKRKGRITAWLLAIVMMLSLVPGSGLQVQAAGSLQGAHSASNSAGDVFLGGNYIEVGISESGSFGTSTAPTDSKFHPDSGCNNQLGLVSDGDGWNVGEESQTGDFFLPGTEEERWQFGYMIDGTTKIFIGNDRCHLTTSKDAYKSAPVTKDASDISKGQLKAVTTATTTDNVTFEIVVSFGVNDKFYKTEVFVTNNSGKQISDVRFSRSFDPDQDASKSGDYKTYNKVICQPNANKAGSADNMAMVVGRGGKTLSGLFFLAFDNRAVAARLNALAPNSDLYHATDLWPAISGSEPHKATNELLSLTAEDVAANKLNDYVYQDTGIAISFKVGNMASDQKKNLEYYTSLDPDVTTSLEDIIKSAAKVVATAKTITIEDVDPNFYYSLWSGDTNISGWISGSDTEWVKDKTITFKDLEANKNYVVKTVSKDYYETGKEPDKDKTEESDVTTNINPVAPGDSGESEESKDKITISTEWDKIVLSNVRSDYQYQLQDEEGLELTEWLSKGEDGNVTFSDLMESTKYYLVAKTAENEKSDRYEIETPVHPPLNLTYAGNFEGAEVTVPDSVEAGVPWKKEYTLSDVTPKKTPADAYEFIGWSTKADVAEPEYQPGDKVKFEKDTTLYAIWKMPLTYTAEDVTVAYDGQPHTVKVNVTVPETGATITYGTSKDAITSKEPAYTDAGTYQIWYQIAADNYKVERGQKTLTITKATPTLTLKNKTYLEEGQGSIDEAIVTGVNDEELTGGKVTYTYYTDKECANLTTADNGANPEGSAPAKKGIYYVKAVRSADTNYEKAVSNVAKLIIAPDVYFYDENGNKQYCSFEDAFNPEINKNQETVYVAGNTIVDSDVTVPEGYTLEISGGATLTILEGVTFTNEGDIFNDQNAIIDGKGTFVNNGSVTNGTINTVVKNNGTLDHTTLGNSVTNNGRIEAPTTSSKDITNEGEGTVVTKAGKVINRTITFDAKNGLTTEVADDVTSPTKVNIPWGNKLSAIELPVMDNIENVAEFEGWYMDKNCTKPATKHTTGISENITLYAKWKEFSSYDAYWTDKDGKKHYGTLDQVLNDIQNNENVEDVHIQKEVEIKDNKTLPDGVGLVVDSPDGKITLGDGVTLDVPGGIENQGTIGAQNPEAGNPPTIKAPITNKAPGKIDDVQVTGDVKNESGAKLGNTTINGDLENDGSATGTHITGDLINNGNVTDGKVDGNLTNGEDGTVTNTNVTGDLTNSGNVAGGKVDGNVTNNISGIISNTDINDDKFDNNGTYKNNTSGIEAEVTYNVTYYINGTVSTTVPVKRAAKITKPERPEIEEGKAFSGWYVDSEYTTLWRFDKNKVTADQNLYAKITPITDYEACWVDGDDLTYGSLNDALKSGSDEVKIIKKMQLSDGVTIPEDVNVTIEEGIRVTIPDNVNVTVNGTLNNEGTILNEGTIQNNGQITNNGTLNNDSGRVAGNGNLVNNKDIHGGVIEGPVTNEKDGDITNATLSGEVLNKADATITKCTLDESSRVQNEGIINKSDVKGTVENKDNGRIVDGKLDVISYNVQFDIQNHGTQTPEEQNIVCGRKVKEPERLKDADYVFVGWYRDQAFTKQWNFAKDTVIADIILYAKWIRNEDCDAYWTSKDGKRNYGTLKEASEAGGTDIHIQNTSNISEDITIPEGVTVTVDKDVTVTVVDNGKLNILGNLINQGTIKADQANVTPQIIGNVENKSGATIQGAAIDGNVTNSGDIKETDIIGNVTNKQGGVITGGTIAGDTSEKQPKITNEAGATIVGTDITGNVDNAGTLGGENSNTTVTGNLNNTGTVDNTKISGATINTGSITKSQLDGETTNSGDIDQSTVAGKTTNEQGGTITAGTVTGETTNNGTIFNSNIGGALTNNGSLEGITSAPDAKIDTSNPNAIVKDADGNEITYTVTYNANGHGIAPQTQTVAYGKFVTKPVNPSDETYTLKGWYRDAAFEIPWNFKKDVVTEDVILYAKWSPKSIFEATWKTEEGQDTYGTLEEAIALGVKDIHIWKDYTIENNMIIPEDVTVTVDDKVTVTVPEDVTVSVSKNAQLINNGTVKNESKIDGAGTVTNNGTVVGSVDSTVDANVVNNGKLKNSKINGSLENNGIVNDTILNGKVVNNRNINNSEINAGLKNNGKVTTDGDEILYKDQTVKGDITKGDDKENVTDATITFQQGNDKQPEQKVTDGKYNVSGLKNGYYNVVIPSEDGKVNTFLVKVEDDEIQMKAFNLPEGNLSNEVIVEEGTPNIVVGGLEDMLVPSGAASKETAGVTAADQRIAREGGDVDIKFIAKQLETTTDEAAQIEQKMKEDNKEVGMNLDLSVLKTVTKTKGDDSTTTEIKLTELDQTVMVRIPIDKDKQGKKNYVIYRSHTNADGTTIDRITEKQNSDGEYIVVEDNGTAITLYTKKFSTYVLGYDSDKKETPAPEDPKPTTTEQPATEATTTEKPEKDPTADFTQEQKQAVSTLMDTMKVSEAEAAEMVQFAADNGIALETMMITGQSVMAQKDDNDIAGSTFGRLQARSDKLTNTSAKIRWTKVKGADGYYIYGNKCGKKNKYKLVKEIKKAGTTSYTQKKLTKGTYYKYIVIAYKKIGTKKITIAASKTVHATTTGGKYGVAAGVKVNKKTITLNSKKKFTIKASEIRKDKKIKKHRAIAYETSNNKIATVNSKGVIKGMKKGTCYVYVYAQNGVYQKIKVKVK